MKNLVEQNNCPNAADYDSPQKYDKACRLYFLYEMFITPIKPIPTEILDSKF